MIFFVSSLGLYRSMEAEIKMKAYYNLLLSPIDKGYIFISDKDELGLIAAPTRKRPCSSLQANG